MMIIYNLHQIRIKQTDRKSHTSMSIKFKFKCKAYLFGRIDKQLKFW